MARLKVQASLDRYVSESDSDTRKIGEEFGKQLPPDAIVTFFGDLGAGKTTFIKGLASAVAGCPPEDVCSPTFTYLNIYEGSTAVYHFDLYRLDNAEAFMRMGFDEFFSAGGVCCIEWSERIIALLPSNTIKVHLKHLGEDRRAIEITWQEPLT